jgi:hypothetical protein
MSTYARRAAIPSRDHRQVTQAQSAAVVGSPGMFRARDIEAVIDKARRRHRRKPTAGRPNLVQFRAAEEKQ